MVSSIAYTSITTSCSSVQSVHQCVTVTLWLSIPLPKILTCPSKQKGLYTLYNSYIFGLELDTVKFEIRLPEDKLVLLKAEIQKFQNKSSASLKELQSLIGLQNFACKVVPPGRTFLRRIINLTIGL